MHVLEIRTASFIHCAVLMQSLTLSCYFACVTLWPDIIMNQATRTVLITVTEQYYKTLLTVIDDANVFITFFSCFRFTSKCSIYFH